MVNYAFGFHQLETRKYFERIIINLMAFCIENWGRITLQPDISNGPQQTPETLAEVCLLTIWLLSTYHRTSVLFDQSKMLTFHWTSWISVHTFLKPLALQPQYIGLPQICKVFHLVLCPSVFCCCSVAFFLVLLLVFFSGSGLQAISLAGMLVPLPLLSDLQLPLPCPGWELLVVAWGILGLWNSDMGMTSKTFDKNSPEGSKKESCLSLTSCKLKNSVRKPQGHVLV